LGSRHIIFQIMNIAWMKTRGCHCRSYHWWYNISQASGTELRSHWGTGRGQCSYLALGKTLLSLECNVWWQCFGPKGLVQSGWQLAVWAHCAWWSWLLFIREAENLCTSKWHCLDFIWSSINHIHPLLSHFDLIKSQKFENEFVIKKGSRTQNQV
jgi:hypothetical protein